MIDSISPLSILLQTGNLDPQYVIAAQIILKEK